MSLPSGISAGLGVVMRCGCPGFGGCLGLGVICFQP